jgi:phospho-N-acetylmuramoyl-pentapeptide-transferase
VVLLITGSFGVLGFMDDYAKVTKQTTAGLSSGQKLVAQFVISILASVVLILFSAKSPVTPGLETSMVFPIFKNLVINLGWFYVAFAALTIAGFSNAVNLTDGLDGLAIVPVMIAASTFGLITYLVGNYKFADYLNLHFVPGVGELAVVCGAIIGGGMGFLWYNAPPAKIFMGDTGSLALGGALGAIAVCDQARAGAGHRRRPVRGRGAVGDDPGRLFQEDQEAHLPDGADPPPFREAGLAESTVVIRFWIVAMMLASSASPP